MNVIVIGLGCVGSAVAATLAKRGVSVICLEQFEIGHEKGSSAHQSRAFRMAYAEHEGYVPLLKRSRKLWLELNEQAHETIFYETGGLYLSSKSNGLVQDSINAAKAHDVQFEVLNANEIRNRFSIFAIDEETTAMIEPHAGFIVPERAIEAHINIAKNNGADIREHVTVLGWKESEEGVEVETSGGTIHAGRLVLCKGAWTTEIPLSVSRQVLTWWDTSEDTSSLPVWAIELEDESWLYGFPETTGLPGPSGFKVARHYVAERIDPDDDGAKIVRENDLEDVRPFLEKWLPSAAIKCTNVHTCMYGNSSDGHFRIGKLPNSNHIVVIAGLSGHGFKFQPVLGEIGADLVMTGTTSHEIGFLAL